VATPQNNEAAGMQTVAASSAQGFSEAQFETPAMVADGKLIRDAHLDRYLAAHKQFGGNSAVSVPGGVLRSAASVVPER
jgi:sigma-E factor negative regulatory protein RseA